MLSGVTHNHWHMGIQNTWMGTQQASPGKGLHPAWLLHLDKSSDLPHTKPSPTPQLWECICTWMHTSLFHCVVLLVLLYCVSGLVHLSLTCSKILLLHPLTWPYTLVINSPVQTQQAYCDSLSQHASCLLVFGSKQFPSHRPSLSSPP